MNTSPFTKTQMKKSLGERSGDRGKMPPRSPDLSPCDFFIWVFVKGLVFIPPLPANIEEMKQRITAALETVTKKHATASLARARIPTRRVQSHRRRSC